MKTDREREFEIFESKLLIFIYYAGNYLARRSEEARTYLSAAKIISVPWNVHKGWLLIFKIFHICSRNKNRFANFQLLIALNSLF